MGHVCSTADPCTANDKLANRGRLEVVAHPVKASNLPYSEVGLEGKGPGSQRGCSEVCRPRGSGSPRLVEGVAFGIWGVVERVVVQDKMLPTAKTQQVIGYAKSPAHR